MAGRPIAGPLLVMCGPFAAVVFALFQFLGGAGEASISPRQEVLFPAFLFAAAVGLTTLGAARVGRGRWHWMSVVLAIMFYILYTGASFIIMRLMQGASA